MLESGLFVHTRSPQFRTLRTQKISQDPYSELAISFPFLRKRKRYKNVHYSKPLIMGLYVRRRMNFGLRKYTDTTDAMTY